MARTSSTYMTTIYTSQISSGRSILFPTTCEMTRPHAVHSTILATGLGDSNSKHRHGRHDDVRKFELGDQLVSSRPAR